MDRTRWVGLFSLFVVILLGGGVAYVRPADAGQSRFHKQVVRASWYGGEFKGRRTAAGAPYNPQHLTAAHRTLHMGTRVKVTELRSGRSVVVKITDRGPYQSGRDIDLSYAAARELGIVRRGVARVRVELVEDVIRRPPVPMPIVTASSATPSLWLRPALLE